MKKTNETNNLNDTNKYYTNREKYENIQFKCSKKNKRYIDDNDSKTQTKRKYVVDRNKENVKDKKTKEKIEIEKDVEILIEKFKKFKLSENIQGCDECMGGTNLRYHIIYFSPYHTLKYPNDKLEYRKKYTLNRSPLRPEVKDTNKESFERIRIDRGPINLGESIPKIKGFSDEEDANNEETPLIITGVKNIALSNEDKKKISSIPVWSHMAVEKFDSVSILSKKCFASLKYFNEFLNGTYDNTMYIVSSFTEIEGGNLNNLIYRIELAFKDKISIGVLKTSHFNEGEKCIIKFIKNDLIEENVLESSEIGMSDGVDKNALIKYVLFSNDVEEDKIDKLSMDICFSSDNIHLFTTNHELNKLYKEAKYTMFYILNENQLMFESAEDLNKKLNNVFKSDPGKIIANYLLNDPPSIEDIVLKPINEDLIIEGDTKLNKNQEIAVKTALTDYPMIIISSPPGTESNQACDAFAEQLRKINSSKIYPIQLISYTHDIKRDFKGPYDEKILINRVMGESEDKLNSVDKDIVKKYYEYDNLWNDEDWRKNQSHESLKKHLIETEKLKRKYKKIFLRFYKVNIIIMTANYAKMIYPGTIYAKKFKPKRIIIDESSQMCFVKFLELMTLYPRVQYIFFGDEKQLPPYMSFLADTADDKMGIFGKSLMDVSNKCIGAIPLELKCSYRMHPDILEFISNLFYKNSLICGVNENDRSLITSKFSKITSPLMIIDTKGSMSEKGRGQSLHNEDEAKHVIRLLRCFKKKEISSDDISVICMYKSQVDILLGLTDSDYMPEISTVDSFQGSENEIIILCTTKTNEGDKTFISNFLQDHKRLNVAFSRAKCGLFIFCDYNCLEKAFIWSKMLNYISKKQKTIKSSEIEKIFS
uniref:AAA_12 domain-containing protein n=1 Tax=Parastrongyloides trichosuri TaxID=131310 RepID=A0A0N4ZQV0_PARTI